MVDYSRYDESTLRSMLEASCDLDERQQLRSILRRLKKHSNTVCFSPNMENAVNNQRNHSQVFSLAAPLERLNCSSAPCSPFTRRSELLEKYRTGQHGNCKTAPDELRSCQNGTRDKNTLRVINGWNKTPQAQFGGCRNSFAGTRNPVECLKQNLGKTLSEPIINDDSKVAQSRLIIQQMLAPRMSMPVKIEDEETSKMMPSKYEENRKSVIPTITVGTDADSSQPCFTRPLYDLWVAEGEMAVLECNVIAKYQPMVLWYRNSEPLRLIGEKYVHAYDGNLVQLTILNMDGGDVGVYECVARNAYGKSSSSCRLALKGDGMELESSSKPKIPTNVTVRRSETLPSSILTKRFMKNSAGGRLLGEMAAGKPPSVQEPSNVRPAGEVEEEAVARSTRTEKASDGENITTTTTVTTQRAKDDGHLMTKQMKQIKRVGGIGTTNYSINKCSAAPRLAMSFNEADFANKLNYSEDIGFSPLKRSATTVKQKLLEWCRITLKDYQHVNITNFSTSWNDGMAFCALVHHFIPDAFDYDKLDPKNHRENFQLAFETAERRAGITPLLDVEDMVKMTVPDWKCVFMYVQSIYREFMLPKQEKTNVGNALDAHQ